MPTKEIVITLRLQIDTDADVRVEVATDEQQPTVTAEGGGGLTPAVEAFVQEHAPRGLVEGQLDFLRRCADELALSVELPATNAPRTYLNLFPPKRYGAKRAGVLETRTGRVDIYCSPTNVEGRRFAEQITNNGVPFAAKVYVKSDEAVDEALELMGIGMEER